jgi:hypothetical protein
MPENLAKTNSNLVHEWLRLKINEKGCNVEYSKNTIERVKFGGIE